MIKKFYATTTRDALRQVRDALGANAIILSNRQVAGGVEIIAVADLDMANLTAQAEPAVLSHSPRPPPPPPPRAAEPGRQMTLEEAGPQLTAFADYLAQRDATPLSRLSSHSGLATGGSGASDEPLLPGRTQSLPKSGLAPGGLSFSDEPSLSGRTPGLPKSAQAPGGSGGFGEPGTPGRTPGLPKSAQAPGGSGTFGEPGAPGRTQGRPKSGLAPGGSGAFDEPVAQLFRPSPARQARPSPQPSIAQEGPYFNPHNSPTEQSLQPEVHELAREIRMLRGLVEGQLAGFAWNDMTRRDPLRAETMKRLLAAGFSSAFARQLLESLPSEESDLNRALKWVKSAIGHNLRIAGAEHDIIERGGVYALVGPTGVGKTTTVAKLAARAVLRHGAAKVALVTTDTYRIGAQDQLRIYGRILGTPVFAVRDESDLELTLVDLSSRHLVLIDTVGMSQRDKRVAEQVALLSGASQGEDRGVMRLLLLGAPSQGITLEEVARAYSGPGLIGCILTKIDEALTYGPVLDVAIRHELPLHYITNGQRVPEDLHQANPAYLADRAFRMSQAESPFKQEEGDYPILMAASQENALAASEAARGGLGATG